MRCELLVNARRNHDFLREFEEGNVGEEAVALRDNASCVIEANV
jgi:hypothetical protein